MLYREHHVPHYLILDPDRRSIEWITRHGSRVVPSDEGSSVHLELDDGCTIRIECGRLFE